MAKITLSRWQSVLETMALVVVAVAVAHLEFVKSSPGASAARNPGAPTRPPEPPLPRQPVSLIGAQTAGSQTAKAALIVYSDFQCPFCAKFARETLPEIEAHYVKTGKVLLAFRQFPLPNHQLAQKAAEAALCAGRQGRFWPFHDDLFEHQQDLGVDALQGRAQRLGLNEGDFHTCLDGQTLALVQSERSVGATLGVIGTPTFFVGPRLKDGSVRVAHRFSGALPLAAFQSVLDRVLATAPASGRGQ